MMVYRVWTATCKQAVCPSVTTIVIDSHLCVFCGPYRTVRYTLFTFIWI